MDDRITEYMREALRLAREGMRQNKGGPFGAVIVCEGKVVGKGQNCVTSVNDPTAHAEIQAIRDACHNLDVFQLQACEIYCTCEPCPMCLAAIYWARIAKIYYAANQDDAAAIDFNDQHIYQQFNKHITQRDIKSVSLLREEGLLLFKEWALKENKVQY